MMKIVTVIGARPQIIKAAALSRAIRSKFSDQIEEVIVHTGQHYDMNMSDVFIHELNIPQPSYNLQVGSDTHGRQTANMIEGIEKILLEEKPDCIVLYGDTNSTLAGAIAASKIHIPVVHIEAGLRSFNKSMPEEINRIMCDHVSTLLFSPTLTGYNNLRKEGFPENNPAPFTPDKPKIYHCGDVMYDNSLFFSEIARAKSTVLQQHGLRPDNYLLATIHRDNNTDNPQRLTAIFEALHCISLSGEMKILLPLHPRTSKLLDRKLPASLLRQINQNPLFILTKPVSFIDMIQLERNASMIVTDSGGVQKEAYFFKKPCLIMRSETEWTEIVAHGCGKITDADKDRILEAYDNFKRSGTLAYPEIFGDGHAAEFICRELLNHITPPSCC